MRLDEVGVDTLCPDLARPKVRHLPRVADGVPVTVPYVDPCAVYLRERTVLGTECGQLAAIPGEHRGVVVLCQPCEACRLARATRPTPPARAGHGSRPIRRITGEEAEALAARLAADYRRGKSIRALAEDTGRSYGATHRLLVASGAELRPRGHPRRVDQDTA